MNFLTNLNLNKNQLQNAVIHPLAVAPSNPVRYQIYTNSGDGVIYQYVGTAWRPVGVVYQQNSSTGVVITGLDNAGNVTTTDVVDLTLTGYTPVSEGYVSTGMTLEQAIAALDTAVKNAVAGGGEVNQNAWSNISVPAQSAQTADQVDGNAQAVQIAANSKTDTFQIASGDAYIQVQGDASNKRITLGHKFSQQTADTYGSGTQVPVITTDSAGHITGVTPTAIPNIGTLTGITGNVQEQLDNKIDESRIGVANGVASLGGDGLVPAAQLPSYVDDVVEAYIVGSTPLAANWLSLTPGGAPLTPESGKIYVVISDGEYKDHQYRWGGTTYVLCNPSDVNSVNGKTGIVVLTQDDIGDGTTYVRYSKADKDKLATVEEDATSNTITMNGTTNQNPTFYAPTGGGTSGQILFSAGNGNAPTWGAVPEYIHKYTTQNPTLSASGGAFTWSITAATSGFTYNNFTVQVYEVATGAMVMTDVNINQANYNVSIIINDVNGAGTLAASTYRVVMVG